MKRIVFFLSMVLSGGLYAAEKPSFPVRGLLPWHDFLSGPTTWDEEDYQRELDTMKDLDLNMLVLHCYTGGSERYGPYVEPMIRMEYRNVLPEAAFDTSLTARWGYRPLAIRDFAFDTGKLFPTPEGAGAFGSRVAVLPRNKQERYQQAQHLIQRVIEMAHQRGIQVALGFEFGVYPPELNSVVPSLSHLPGNELIPDPTHWTSMEVLRLTIDNIIETYPGIDWIWFWLQETTPVRMVEWRGKFAELMRRDAPLFPEASSQERVFFGVWSLAYIRAAHEYVVHRAPKIHLAIGGFAGANQLLSLLPGLDRELPKEIVFTCLNPMQGQKPQPALFGEIAKHRPVWVVPWLEGDDKLWHLQPRVSILRESVLLARQQNLNGVIALHWRTEEARANMRAFAAFARHPDAAPDVESFYENDCADWYGPSAASELAPLLVRMEREQWFEPLRSEEYIPYVPEWGRLAPELQTRFVKAVEQVEALVARAGEPRHKANLNWLAANLRFTILLDEVGRKMEPAYQLKARWLQGEIDSKTLAQQAPSCRAELESAPVRELFQTYASRVRSRGELGELSSLNQKLWLEYLDLRRFLDDRR